MCYKSKQNHLSNDWIIQIHCALLHRNTKTKMPSPLLNLGSIQASIADNRLNVLFSEKTFRKPMLNGRAKQENMGILETWHCAFGFGLI